MRYPILTSLCVLLLATCNMQPGNAPAPTNEGPLQPEVAPRQAAVTPRDAPRPPRVDRRDRRGRRGLRDLKAPGRQLKNPRVPGGLQGEPWAAPTGAPERVAIQDLDGDGRPEVLLMSHEGLWITDTKGKVLAKERAWGHPNAVALGSGAGAERGTFAVGWGYGRHQRTGPARVVRYRFRGGAVTAETIHTHESSKPLVTGLAFGTWKGRRGLLVAAFKDKYHVSYTFLVAQGAAWRAEPVETIRMATSFTFAALRKRGVADLVVGRVYGDQRGAPGDAFLWQGPGRRLPIAIQGGVRAMTAADLGGNGQVEVVLSDGWAAAYRKDGRALITRAFIKNGIFATERLGELPGEFMVQKLEAVDLDADGKPEILALGNATLTVLRRKGNGPWAPKGLTGGTPQDFAVGDLDGDGKPDVLVLFRGTVRLLRNAALR